MIFKFVAGNKINHALKSSKKLLDSNRIPIINYISENQKKNNQYIFTEYEKLIKQIDYRYYIALKCSSFNFNYHDIENIGKKCIEKNIKLIIDAENDECIEKYRSIVNNLILKYNNNYKDQIIKTYQMYRKDSLDELNDDLNFYSIRGCYLPSKLVRGAYWNTDKNSNKLYINKISTDNNFNNAINSCYYSNFDNHLICTHNKKSIDIIRELNTNKNSNKFIIANLMGMNEKIMNNIHYKTASYIPYGPYIEMIPYLTRRLYENIDQLKYIN